MLGVPPDMRPSIVEWSDAMAEQAAAYGDVTHPAWIASEAAKADFANYLEETIRERRRVPGEDLVSQIVVSDVAATMTDFQIMQNCRQLLFAGNETRSEEHTSELQSLMRISYAVFCLKKQNTPK